MNNSGHQPDAANLPPLVHDSSFLGMTATQFLGAFNDNLFKQLVLLLCVDFARRGGHDYQPIAMALFAIPFVLFSGFGGYLSDRTGKRRIVVLCKIAEIAVMTAGLFAFLSGKVSEIWQLNLLFVVLFLMSTQSAFFGPAKYGILPEMLRPADLPAANGVIQMTTFVAIIFGWALAGYSKDWFQTDLWIVSLMCIGIAVVGTATSLLVRKTRVAHPGLPFQWSALAVNRDIRKLLRQDRSLLGVLAVSSLFWFVGGVVQPAVNAFGKLQLHWSDGRTSMMGACMGVGIAFGCVLAGKLSRRQINFHLVTIGAWGLIACLGGLAWLGHQLGTVDASQSDEVREIGLLTLLAPQTTEELTARLLLTGLGGFAGLFVVPLQVFLQARPPKDQKGRMIGTMNLINWIGIVCSAIFYSVAMGILNAWNWDVSWIFAGLAVCLLPVALFYHPTDTALE